MAFSRVSHVPCAPAKEGPNGEGIGTGGIARLRVCEGAQMEVVRVEKKMFER